MNADFSQKNLITNSRLGLRKNDLLVIQKDANLTLKEFATFLQISERLIQTKDKESRFSSRISEQALYIARLYTNGIQIFGDKKKFFRWMDSENVLLGGVKPKSFLDTISGIQYVSNFLHGIEHGFPA